MSPSRQEEIRRLNDPAAETELRGAEKTRQSILDAAQEYLWTHPFRDLTVADLMEQTGVSRPTFYRYFADLHDLMEELLTQLKEEILEIAEPWFTIMDDPPARLRQSLDGLVKVCYQRGPILRAVVDAAPSDERLESAWEQFIRVFDEAVTQRIEQDQASGLVDEFDARSVAISLNRMDVGVLMHHFGRRPRSNPEPVRLAITKIWISTIYGKHISEDFSES